MNTLRLQELLKAEGFDPGPLDGVMGGRTLAAVLAFQAANGLEPDGIVGPFTLRALLRREPKEDEAPSLPWMVEARRHLGLQEGTRAADRLMNLDTKAIPWCGAFASMVLAAALPTEPRPDNPLWARNWTKFGVSIERPAVGAVAVFSRGAGGHVGFVAGHDRDSLHILGGNQSNRVSIARLSKDRLLGLRWPLGWERPSTVLPFSTLEGTLSTNEA